MRTPEVLRNFANSSSCFKLPPYVTDFPWSPTTKPAWTAGVCQFDLYHTTSHIGLFSSSIVQRRNDLLRELFIMVQTTRQDMKFISLGCETDDSDLQTFLERFDLNKECVEWLCLQAFFLTLFQSKPGFYRQFKRWLLFPWYNTPPTLSIEFFFDVKPYWVCSSD